MLKSLWINARLYSSKGIIEKGRMLVGLDGLIESIGGSELDCPDAQVIDAEGLTILPGFIDIHVHGGNGHDVMDGTYESLNAISRFHAAHGTTSFLATTTTAEKEAVTKALICAAEAGRRGVSGAELLGIHLEGPFLNEKRRGAQNKDHIQVPNADDLEHYMRASDRQIRLVTLAPEVDGGMDAVRYFHDRGITVSAGHSDAAYEQVMEAISLGLSHTTHHFNGMSPLHHREPGLAGAGMMHPELTTEIIVDGVHVHPAAVKLLFDAKTPMNVCIITDAISCCGLPDGEYGEVQMMGGQIYLKDGSSLAGSSLTMIQALKNGLQFTGYSLEYLLPSLTWVPARQIRMAHKKGSLDSGKDADFLVVDDEWNIRSTYVRGKEVYRSSAE